MPDLRDLYQEVILDHSKRPRNFRKPEGANRHADGYNPLCGDKVTIYLTVLDGRVHDAAFQGSGCAISTASASMMTERLKGRTVEEAEALFSRFHQLLTSGEDPANPAPELGKLAAFAGVREYPMRVKCATLAWHTLRSALDETGELAPE
ncbi:MAG: SUF system NifU family Fe-S cluster assembly protein [Acidobacteriia bacterium]|nr:SUF system NifU family Fe-S cluster assembly protein [Terriglobia bacterium]